MEEQQEPEEQEEPITTTIINGLASEAGRRTREAVTGALVRLTKESPDLAKAVERVSGSADNFVTGLIKALGEEFEDRTKK